MRSLRSTLAVLAVVVVAACTSTTPAWTYAPVPSTTPIPSVEASAGASGAPAGSAAPSAAASGAASAAPSAAASGGIGNGTIIKLVAQQIEFDQTTLSAPAGTPFNIEFLNDDAGVPHDVWIKDSTGAAVFKGDVFPGVATKNYAVPALTAGQYTFYCTVHSNMTGTLTAG